MMRSSSWQQPRWQATRAPHWAEGKGWSLDTDMAVPTGKDCSPVMKLTFHFHPRDYNSPAHLPYVSTSRFCHSLDQKYARTPLPTAHAICATNLITLAHTQNPRGPARERRNPSSHDGVQQTTA
ncbi:hypothetical protein E2C01_080755 [Portunus trituberculatus]|uniref:Uncharacterized protein n=1 Tax=Portunus trituberculatus TaxID=210409 RepID=A0A5B7IZ67_PORTR|nr:hypothetical protein [Portunus trituberculatus]